MGVIKTYLLLLFLFLTAGIELSAQNYATREVNGKEYYLYYVEPGNTLYAISRLFSVDLTDLVNANPDARNGLSIGQEILIPVKAIDKKAARKSEVEVEGNYILHTVQKKETLFSISRDYGVTLNDLIELNPEYAETLSTGVVLKIPAVKSKNVETTFLEPARNDTFVVHQIKSGETAYSLAKEYNVLLDSLNAANNDFKDGFRVGQYIVIPKYKESFLQKIENDIVERSAENLTDLPTGRAGKYQMALMLPFELQLNDSLEKTLMRGEDLYLLTEIALEYYRGSVLALDSLKKLGLNTEVFVYDIGEDIVDARDVIRRPEMGEMDIIFGPMHKASLAVVSESARQKKIYVVSPNTFGNEVFEENPYLMRATASRETMLRYLANFVAINHRKNNVVMISSGLKDEWTYRKMFIENYNRALAIYPNSFADSLRSITKSTLANNLSAYLKKDTLNVLVIPSNDLAFVSDMMTRISRIGDDYPIQVYGLDKWVNYENIEAAYKNKMNLRLVVPSFKQYESREMIEFLEKYRGRYGEEPSHYDYGFMGYDLTLFFGKALLKYGLDFPAHFDEMEMKGLIGKYRYGKSTTGLEYENKEVYIVEYDDYELKRVN